jgi:hypothetical protein
VKKNGRERRRILKGIIESAKSALIAVNKGEINQKGRITTNEAKRKTKK